MATAAVREVERKYEPDAGTPAALPPLEGIDGVSQVTEEPMRELDAVYYDTSDLRLAAARITLRRRTGGPDAGWHLKLSLPGDADTREEVHAPLGDAATVPEELRSLVRSRVRDEALVPAVRLHTLRTPHTLRGLDGRPLAEVVLDRVTARVVDPAAPEVPALPQEWTEVEVELAPDAALTLLDAVEHRLAEAGLHRSSSPSKLARALHGRLTETRTAQPRTTPRKRRSGPTAADTVLAYAATQIQALIELDPAVRRELPDSVHRMRVAARRLRSTFRSYRTVLDPAVTAPLVEELRRLGVELGFDRDREVLAERLRQRLAEQPGALVLGPVPERLRTWSAARRSGSRLRLLTALDDPRHLALLNSLDALLADPPLLPAAHRPAKKVLKRTLRKELRRLGTRVDAALTADRTGTERDHALHDSRKASKRARYAAEVAIPVLGRRAKRYRGAMRDLQELLGDHQDSVVAREALRGIAVEAHEAGENAFTYGVLHAAEAGLAQDDERRLPKLWRRAVRAAG